MSGYFKAGFNLEVAWDNGSQSKSIRIETNAPTPPGLSALIGFMLKLTDRIQSVGQKS